MTKEQFDALFYSPPEPSQHPFEFFSLLNFIEQRIPELKVVVEVGVFKGGTFKFWSRMIKPEEGILVGIDSGERGYIDGLIEHQKRYEHFIVADSTKNETFLNVRNLTKGMTVDIVFIDGNHEYQYVQSDYIMYSSLVRTGGLIIFHDLVNPTVQKVWGQAKDKRDYEGIVEFYGKERPCGIGVIVK
jgi:cephalosporin hydroxylase